MRKLCPYHEDSLSWDECTEGFEGCQVKEAREEAAMEEKENVVVCPVCNHVITDFDEGVSDPCEHVVVSYVDICGGEFVHEGDEKIAEEIMDHYHYLEDHDDYVSLDELMEQYAEENERFEVVSLTTYGLSCGHCSSTEYHLIKTK